MNIELPQHLQATADLLSRSFPGHSQDHAPSLPKSLVEDFVLQDEPQVAPKPKISLFSKARSFIATPAFGLAAAALIVIGFFSPALLGPADQSTPREAFRGSKLVHATNSATVVLITDEPETRQLLEDSGLFDMEFVIETSDPLVAVSIPTAKLLVDVKGGAIVGYNAESREVVSDELPTDRSKLAERIALAFGALH
ncbi:MAG: hypothetical protein AAGI48_14895 [Verrucomicrobiota bacterium]